MLLRTSYLIIHQTVAINVVLFRVMTVSIKTEDGFGEAHDVIIEHLSHIVVELYLRNRSIQRCDLSQDREPLHMGSIR